MQKFSGSGNPSETFESFWLFASCSDKKLKKATKRTGKWLAFVAQKYVDDTWHNIELAVASGKLWRFAKVSTAVASRTSLYVLSVYTYDHDDESDVMRIREALRDLGFKRALSYKTDEQTEAGVYSDVNAGLAKYKA